MKRYQSTIKIILAILILFGVTLLSGCVKKSDDVYFLRGIAKEYRITFQGDNDYDYVTNDIILHETYQGAKVEWASSKPLLVSTTGKVTLPTDDETVVLTATFSVGDYIKEQTYELHLISQKSIDRMKYQDALNKILLLETRNNLTNYNNAGEALELIDPTYENYQNLKDRYLIQEKIREADNLVTIFLDFPTTASYNQLMTKLNALPAHNQYVTTYKTTINEVQEHLAVGDKVRDLVNNKTLANYDEAKTLVEALPDTLASKYNLEAKLESVKKYLDNLDLLNLNNVTQAELETIVRSNATNKTILAEDIAGLEVLYNTNQTRLFNELTDKGFVYITSKIDGFKTADILTDSDLAILNHLINNFNEDTKPELLAKLKILILSKEVTQDHINKAQFANNQITNNAVRIANNEILNEYRIVLSLEEKFANLNATKNNIVNFTQFNDDIIAVKTDGQKLTITQNVKWFNNQFKIYDFVNQVINLSDEILEIPLAYDGEGDHPLITLISEAKKLSNDTALSNEIQLKRQLINLIEKNTLIRLNELQTTNENNPSKENHDLLGQLLAQTDANDYGTYLMRAYKDELDSESRLSQSSVVVTRVILIFIAIVVFFVSQAMTADYASKKGYEGLIPSLISLIPIGGWFYFYKKPKRRNISKSGIKQVYKPSEVFAKLLIYAEIVIIATVVIVPIIYIFGMALSNLKTDIPSRIWPENPTWESFNYLFNETRFKTWWSNTFMIAMINMLIGTVLITGASYVFARFNFKGKKAGLMTILVLQSFPSFMGLIAMYVLFWKFGLLGQPLALTILYIGGGIPGNVWLIKGFMDQIPRDLDESAMIDGANKLQIFFRIIMPLAVPILTFVAVNMFMAPWMDYMLPGYLLNIPRPGAPIDHDITEQWTLAVGLFKLINDPNTLHYSAFAAGALIVGVPITLLYMFFQKYLIEGIMAGATKG
ncbi:MAG: ABC transporter permease subunit [Acholeplasmataceae bacterium]|jgi:arabinogalactan oligomer/maltooligosaccharide transport system permease protein